MTRPVVPAPMTSSALAEWLETETAGMKAGRGTWTQVDGVISLEYPSGDSMTIGDTIDVGDARGIVALCNARPGILAALRRAAEDER